MVEVVLVLREQVGVEQAGIGHQDGFSAPGAHIVTQDDVVKRPYGDASRLGVADDRRVLEAPRMRSRSNGTGR